jgi:putative glutamine amidotransferase
VAPVVADGTAPIVAVVGRRAERVAGMRTGAVVAGERYLAALDRAGALAVVLGPDALAGRDPASVLGRLGGLVLTGGGDVDPARYGEAPAAELRGVDPVRDGHELALVDAALAMQLPVLAVCRGLQVLNVACGGSLHQDIGADIGAVAARRHQSSSHPVDTVPGTRLAAVAGPHLAACPSVHHQAVARLGRGLTVAAWAPDGLIEAIEHEGPTWVLGVQWHPEDTAAVDAEQQALFDAFVAAAGRRAATGQ